MKLACWLGFGLGLVCVCVFLRVFLNYYQVCRKVLVFMCVFDVYLLLVGVNWLSTPVQNRLL